MTQLDRIELYLNRTGTSATRFGRTVARDPRLVGDLRNGRSPGPLVRARIEAQLAVISLTAAAMV